MINYLVRRIHIYLSILGNYWINYFEIDTGYFFYTHKNGEMLILCHASKGALWATRIRKICDCDACTKADIVRKAI